MSATRSIRIAGDVPVTQADRNVRPGLGRLAAVELRKMVNTRSGFWVPIAVALLTLAGAVIASANHGGRSATFTHVLHVAAQPAALLLPVMGVLLICGEWSQRTTLSTFTLVPNRWRVIGAKVLASLVAATVALVFCLVVTVVCATVFGNHPGGTGSLSWQVVAQSWIFLASAMVMGLAFGAAVLVSAPAIVVYLLLPAVWNAVVGSIHSLAGLAAWLDASVSLDPLTQHAMSGRQWSHALATFAVWIGIPLVIGWRRIGRGDLD